MEGKIAFLYAGQGSQYTGMGRDLYDQYPEFKKVFDDNPLDVDLKVLCFENPDNLLQKTEYTQPCMVAFACGVTEILKKKHIIPDYVCGLSLGEYSALYAADVWSFQDTMRIIDARGKAMAAASAGIDSAMIAIIGLDKDSVAECCKKASNNGIASICNINCPDQIVIGGKKIAVEKAAEYAKEVGARRCISLQVSGPFHTVYMKSAGEQLRNVLDLYLPALPRYEVLYNYLGGPRKGEQEINDLLVNQIQNTVRMQECIAYLIKQSVKCFIEIGPGTALGGFVKKTIKNMGLDPSVFFIISLNNINDVLLLSKYMEINT